MTAARRLARFRAALVAFVSLTVPFVFVALPTIYQVANIQNLSEGWMPTPARVVFAVVNMVAWWGSGVAAWTIEDRRLYANRRTTGAR